MKRPIDFEKHLASIGIAMQFIALLVITFPLRELIYGKLGLPLIGLFVAGMLLLFGSNVRNYVKIAIPLLCVALWFPLMIGWMALLGSTMPVANCDIKNAVFEKYPFDSKEYKDEVVRQLNAYPSEHVTYWIKDYVDEQHISVYMQSEHICAIGHMRVDEWKNELEYLKHEKEWPDGNCPIMRFKYDIVQTPGNTEFVFRGMLGIVDCD